MADIRILPEGDDNERINGQTEGPTTTGTTRNHAQNSKTKLQGWGGEGVGRVWLSGGTVALRNKTQHPTMRRLRAPAKLTLGTSTPVSGTVYSIPSECWLLPYERRLHSWIR